MIMRERIFLMKKKKKKKKKKKTAGSKTYAPVICNHSPSPPTG